MLVADINKKFIKNRELATLRNRNRETTLEHILQDTEGLKTYRLTSSIRTRDNKYSIIPIQSSIQWHKFPSISLKCLCKQRMASLNKPQLPIADNWLHSIISSCPTSLGTHHINPCHILCSTGYSLNIYTHQIGKSG